MENDTDPMCSPRIDDAARDTDALDRFIHYALTQSTSTAADKQETRASLLACEETCLTNSPLTGTPHFVADQMLHPAPEGTDLMDGYNDCQLFEQWRWSCEYRKNRKKIGHGGQGVVYLIECMDTFFGDRALKILSPEPYADPKKYYEDMERMKSVASVVEHICHSNLIQVERFESLGGIYVMVMRLIDGYDLHYMLHPDVAGTLLHSVRSDSDRWVELRKVVFEPCVTQRAGLKPGFAVNIVENCLRGLGALHAKGIVHCDVKPSNIMLESDGSIRLIDIGSAFKTDSPPAHHAWTPRYAPPEVLEGGDWTYRSDLASLGYVLIELLSGRPDVLTEPTGGCPESIAKFAGSDSVSTSKLDGPVRECLVEAKRELPNRLTKLIPVKAQSSQSLMDLCYKLIHPNPEKRFLNANDAITGLGGTYQFMKELSKADLISHWAQAIESCVSDIKKMPLVIVKNGL